MNSKTFFTLGKLSVSAKAFWIGLFVMQFLVILSVAGYYAWIDTSAGCIRCHSNKEQMEKLGAGYLAMTQSQVETESKHPGVHCRQCHLGNGRAEKPEKAHEGMLRLILLGEDGAILHRKDYLKEPFLPSGDDEIRALMPKEEFQGELYPAYDVRNVLYHDRNPDTLGYDPNIAKKTCAQRNCHPEQVEQFSHTVMGSNLRQRTMQSWLKPYGPHNCGPSFVDTPADGVADGDVFDKTNYEEIVKESAVPFTIPQAVDKQRLCNVCHAGCLDCHYQPDKKRGAHGFTKKPGSLSCSGGGRNSTTCHPGAMERRRGDTYLGNDFSEPVGLPPDVHVEQKIECADCHYQGKKGMGDHQRKATCEDCHIEIEEALAKSDHKDVTCAACHIQKVGGYQLTHWGPGYVMGRPNPYKKYSLYYGTVEPPIVMKDQKGKWIAVKFMPHSVANFKKPVTPSPEIQFRWPKGETRDSYYVIGTFDGLPGNNLHLAWFEIQNLSHSLGKPRDCESCHKKAQEANSQWRYVDDYGAKHFDGTYRVYADKDGLWVRDIKNTTSIELLEGFKLEDFAPWLFLGDIWHAPGDFSISTPDDTYPRELEDYKRIKAIVKSIEDQKAKFDTETKINYKAAKGAAFHNPKDGEKLLKPFLKGM
ncbi:MAG TPA: hypothetical protein VJL89_08465 [Thermodesulfovibrionia bacterium]|nr:hypothetical protein [Thermodesulfovibrionia bacterium]